MSEKAVTNEDLKRSLEETEILTRVARSATQFAFDHHHTRKRKWGGESEFMHVRRVALRVYEAGAEGEVVQAGVLHDIVEDCNVSLISIRVRFGKRVEGLVAWCTDEATTQRYPDRNRAERKRMESDRLWSIDPHAIPIKCADFLDNLPSIRENAIEFAHLWCGEKIVLFRQFKHRLDAAAHLHLPAGYVSLLDEATAACMKVLAERPAF